MTAAHVRRFLWGLLPVGAFVGAGWLLVRDAPTAAPAPATAAAETATSISVRPESELPYEPLRFQLTLNESIRYFRDRTRDDPQDFLSLTHLASLYIRQAREYGDHAAYGPAEDALRGTLRIVPGHVPARIGLALVTCARHRFAEGLRLAEEVYREAPEELEAQIIAADAHLELGHYDQAEAVYRELERKGPQPPPSPLLARWARLAELHGDPDRAVRLLRQADGVQRESNDFKETGAWYPMRLGEVLFSQGRLDEAAVNLEAALRDHPRYPAALALMGRVRAAQGKTDEALRLYGEAVRITPNLVTLIELGDLYARAGNAELAKLNYDTVVKTAKDATDFDRELALFYCNHDRQLPRTLELARRDLHNRQDVYAYDTLAWALAKNGQPREAETAMTEALKLGTRDAVLFYHAGVIEQQLGAMAKAQEYLERALAVNPHFAPTQAEDARRRLAQLGGGEKP